MDCIKQMNSRLSISVVFLVLFWSMSGGILKSISGVFLRYRVVREILSINSRSQVSQRKSVSLGVMNK